MNSINMINSILIKHKFDKSKFFLINYNLLFSMSFIHICLLSRSFSHSLKAFLNRSIAPTFFS